MDLVLNTFGTSLIKENDNFLVIHKDGKQKIFPDKIKTISISKGAKISSDAALLAVENEIEVLFIDKTGKPVGRLWSVKYGSISTIRRKQLDFTFSKNAIKWIKEIIIKKIDNQVALLLSVSTEDSEKNKMLDKSINRLNDYKTKIKSLEGQIVQDIAPSLRGWEGASAKIYFDSISEILPDEFKFNSRSKHPALDVFNCLLNYGYGILYGKIEGALIKAGIDPYVGIFHRDDYNRPVLVFDIIELYRVWIDYVVINLSVQKVIDEDCYSIKEDGSYWLESMGKRILIQSVNDYLDEIIDITGISRSRSEHINLYAQKLATKFMNLSDKK